MLEVRPLAARVNDEAGLLAPDEARALEDELAAFERETGHQIAVLTVKTLEGEAIESFALRVAEAWKLGDAKRDDGALVVVASEDRKARIEVGYGLEGVLPDALAARILREQMIPWFKRGEMGQGVRAGVEAVLLAARGEVVPTTERGRERGEGAPSTVQAVLIAVLLGAFIGGNLGRISRIFGSLVGGSLAAFVAFLLTALLSASLLAALAGFFSSLLFSLAPTGPGLHGRGPGGWRGGGYGGWGGGFGGGGFGGGGGFSGGGGGFGGGGASGSW
ncbi:MAG: TPM domain-containing protein [Myxococcota bacterium]